MQKLLNLSKFMIMLSLLVLFQDLIDGVVKVVIIIIATAPLYFIGHYIMMVHKKINDMWDYTLNHKSDHEKLLGHIERHDAELETVRGQFKSISDKLDQLYKELKK